MAVSGYQVRIKKTTDGSFGSWTDVGNVLTHQFTGLDADTEYQAQVRAYDAVPNYSAASSTASATTDIVIVHPDDVPNLLQWVDAAQITGLSDGDPISTLVDIKSGLNYSQSGSARPTYKLVSGNPVVRFDGSDDYMDTASPGTNYAALTIVAVIKNNDTSSAYLLNFNQPTNTAGVICNFVAGKWEWYNTPRTVIGDVSTSDFQVITTTLGNTGGSTVGWRLGTDIPVTSNIAADLKELCIYNRVLSVGELADVVNGLKIKHGIS